MNAGLVKHSGIIKPSGQKCIVVCYRIPGKEDHALVTETDALPDRIHEAVMSVVNSTEGQQAWDVGDVLDRRLLPDTGRTILRELAARNYLRPVSHNDITIYFAPNNGMNLNTLLKGIEAQKSGDPEKMKNVMATERHNQILENQSIDKVEQRQRVASNLLIEANMLENDARRKREEAYRISPELAPKVDNINTMEVSPFSAPETPIMPVSPTAYDVYDQNLYNSSAIMEDISIPTDDRNEEKPKRGRPKKS